MRQHLGITLGGQSSLGRLERDEVAEFLDRIPRWYKIEVDGVTGFVSKSWKDIIF